MDVSCLLQVEDIYSASCGILRVLHPELFSLLQSKELMSRVKSSGFQNGPQAIPRMPFLFKKRFAKCKKADHRLFFFTLGATTLQARCQTIFIQDNGVLCCTDVCAALMLRSDKRLQTISSSLQKQKLLPCFTKRGGHTSSPQVALLELLSVPGVLLPILLKMQHTHS